MTVILYCGGILFQPPLGGSCCSRVVRGTERVEVCCSRVVRGTERVGVCCSSGEGY